MTSSLGGGAASLAFDAVLEPRDPPESAWTAEQAGFAGGWVTETVRDPYLYLSAAAGATRGLGLGTAVAIAFARSPMTTALCAHDVQRRAAGRFRLGLGSQVRPHIERRFSMPWSRPAERMREYVLALRAIWAAWCDGAPLAFRGEFYTHDLMTDFFNPGPTGHPAPPVLLGGVGAQMTALAGEVADGYICGPLTSELTFREHTLPALRRGLQARTGTAAGFEVCVMPLIVTGTDADSVAQASRATRARIAFYASTPAYRQLLDRHGWGAVHDRLRALAQSRRWEDMADLVDDEMLDAFAVVARPEQVAGVVRRRFGIAADRAILGSAAALSTDVWAAIGAGTLPQSPDGTRVLETS